jgi:hybrid cluster-associated redox disulfide protein
MAWSKSPKVLTGNRLEGNRRRTLVHAEFVHEFFVICASAKRDFSQSGIFGGMDAGSIDLQLTVDKILQRRPQAFSVFMKHKTKCVGCFMQQFCTLKDVAETYQIPLQELILEIESVST